MFRRQAIIDRHRHASYSLDQLLHESVVLLDVSHDIPAAMNPQESGKEARPIVWLIHADPHGWVALSARHRVILASHTFDRGQCGLHGSEQLSHLGPGCRNVMQIYRPFSRERLDHDSELRV